MHGPALDPLRKLSSRDVGEEIEVMGRKWVVG